MSNCLQVENLSKSFEKKYIFNNLSFTVSKGKVVGLIGENGVGKTTLLKIIAGLQSADNGTILIENSKLSYKEKEKISFLIDPLNLFNWMRIKDAICYYKDFFTNFDIDIAHILCKQFNLDLNFKIKNLSKGNKERVCLMLNLSRKASLYILDEPLGGLDPKIKKDIVKTLLSYIPENSTVIIATHLLRDLQSIFDEVLILKKDGITLFSADEIREKYNKSIEDYYLEVIDNV
ncbi:ATP-binding cassette domain-containing protein [Clostridium saccharoperbutylacetonicum]|uniref:ATP-binding cassette domain-containing protein n=1 Tax=Clostridium saccharoperbutylacetonicum TaxID=36745 RepID=UPI0039EC3BA6